MENPFRASGVVGGVHFADREEELARIESAIHEPGSRLLVTGPRRMGKTSLVRRALDRFHETKRGPAVYVDFSSAVDLSEMARRLAEAGINEMSRFRGLKGRIEALTRTASENLAFEIGVPGLFKVRIKDRPQTGEEAQRRLFAEVLEQLHEGLGRARQPAVVVIDEFQEIHRFGEEVSEWNLRSVIQHQERLSYLLLGSAESLIQRMQRKNRAFYGMFEKLPVGEIEPTLLATWIDERMREAGMRLDGRPGGAILQQAGPRTRDRMLLARRTFDLSRRTGIVTLEQVDAAREEVVRDFADEFLHLWNQQSRVQKRVLQLVEANRSGITTKASQAESGETSGSLSNAARKLVTDDILVKDPEATPGYRFDDPFFRYWVGENSPLR